MKATLRSIAFISALCCCGAWAQSASDDSRDRGARDRHGRPGAARDIGGGAGNIGAGAAKATGDVAKGAGKTAVNLATLHPIDAAASAGKGAASAGKDVTVGTVKGTGKIARGVGKGLKKIF